MIDPTESLQDARLRIRHELDKLVSQCKDNDQSRISSVLTHFMCELGMDGLEIYEYEYLIEIFGDYILKRFPLMCLSKQQILESIEELLKRQGV